MDTGSFIIHIKTEDVYEDISDDVEKGFDISNFECNSIEVNRPLSTGKNKKVIGLMKDELGGKIMTQFVALRPKTCSYLMLDGNTGTGTHVIKKAKGTKKCVIKIILKFNYYKNSLLNNKIILKPQQRFKSELHNVHTEEINKIALSSSDNKRLQMFDRSTSYIYSANVGKVCKTEILSKYK